MKIRTCVKTMKFGAALQIFIMHGLQICAGKGPPQEARRRPRRRSRLQISILSCSGNRLSDLKILIDTKCDLRLCGKYRCVVKIALQLLKFWLNHKCDLRLWGKYRFVVKIALQIPRLLIEKQNATWGFEQFLIIMYFSKRACCPLNIF